MRTGIAAWLVGLAACSSSYDAGPPGGWEYATAVTTCAPFDGPAVQVVMTSRPYAEPVEGPSLTLYVYHGLADLPGRTVPLGASVGQGSAFACPAGLGPCETASGGSVTFDRSSTRLTLRGRYDVQFASGRQEQQDFTAAVRERLILCG